MAYGQASSFRDVVAFIAGSRSGPRRPYGDFGTFPQFVSERFGRNDADWATIVIEAYQELDMPNACDAFRALLTEWGESQEWQVKAKRNGEKGKGDAAH